MASEQTSIVLEGKRAFQVTESREMRISSKGDPKGKPMVALFGKPSPFLERAKYGRSQRRRTSLLTPRRGPYLVSHQGADGIENQRGEGSDLDEFRSQRSREGGLSKRDGLLHSGLIRNE